MASNGRSGKEDQSLEFIKKKTLRSNGTISYKIGPEFSNYGLDVKVYFVPDAEHIVKIGCKNYAKFRTDRKNANGNDESENCYFYHSILLKMNEDHVELQVKNPDLKSGLSAPAVNATKLTAKIKLNGDDIDIKEIELVGIKVPAKTSKSVG